MKQSYFTLNSARFLQQQQEKNFHLLFIQLLKKILINAICIQTQTTTESWMMNSRGALSIFYPFSHLYNWLLSETE